MQKKPKKMNNKKLETVIHHLKIHLKVMNYRPIFISMTLVLVMLIPKFTTPENLNYIDHYFYSIVRTFILFWVVFIVSKKSYSLRLFILAVMLVFTMGLDLGNLISYDFYYYIKPFRYDGVINYYNGFLLYEILALLWVDIGGIVYYGFYNGKTERCDSRFRPIRHYIVYSYENGKILPKLFRKKAKY